MKKIHVSRLLPGMRLAQPITGVSGLRLWAGEALTKTSIKRLHLHGIRYVYVDPYGGDDDWDKDARKEPARLLPARTRRRAITRLEFAFDDALQRNKMGHSPEIEETAREMVHYLTKHQQIIQSITEIRGDKYLLQHSVNVSALAIMTGACLGLAKEQLYRLGVCGLLHDIGKMKIPRAILEKPDALTRDEYAEVQKHTIYGKKLLAHDPTAARVACQHHERYDGSGYPYGLLGDDIDLFAQIIGVVDVYDAMMADRCYRRALPAREVIEMLSGSGNYHFNFRVVRAFVANIAPYPVGTMVRLSTGQRAVVTRVSPGFPLYPTVRVLTDDKDNPLPEPQEVDLFSGDRRVVITEVEVPPTAF